MPSHEDRSIVSVLLGGVITLCLLIAVGISIHSAQRRPLLRSLPNAEAPDPVGDPLARIYFEINSAELPAEAGGAIQITKEKAAADPKVIVLISGYHDPSGNPEQNAMLAMQRAVSAKDALMAAGVPEEQIRLSKPESIDIEGDPQEARRVDIRVQ